MLKDGNKSNVLVVFHTHRNKRNSFANRLRTFSIGFFVVVFLAFVRFKLGYNLPGRPLFGITLKTISGMCLLHTFDVQTIDEHRMSHQ